MRGDAYNCVLHSDRWFENLAGSLPGASVGITNNHFQHEFDKINVCPPIKGRAADDTVVIRDAFRANVLYMQHAALRRDN